VTVVRIGLAARAAGLSRPACQRYWRTEHARLFAEVPELLSYVQNHAVLDDQGEPLPGDPGFDIFSEVEFTDASTLERVAADRYYRDVVLTDEANLLDASRRTFLMTRRRALAGVPHTGLFKLALFLSTSSEHDRSARTDGWLSEISTGATRAVATTANIVDCVGGTRILPVDVVLQHYFRRLDEARQAYQETRDRGPGGSRSRVEIVTAVIAQELEVVPRTRTEPRVEDDS